jgi:NAD(P)-dependent dehydrogenase (short-subunit alcohol dehydrogenase family)
MNYPQQMLQIDVCALGPLRITQSLYKAGKLMRNGKPGKVIIITSQAGSCEWRFTQNPEGGNYGHHMSRAATNIMGVLLSQELKAEGIPVQLLHPGFNRTSMTEKYEHLWDVEGAVPAAEGAKRVLFEALKAGMATSVTFVNCDDGLRIPWYLGSLCEQ